MTIAEWIGVISVVLVLIGLIGTSNFRVNKEIQASELRSATAIQTVVKDAGLRTVLDEDKFVEVKVCKIVHTNQEKEYAELNKKIDNLTQDVRKLLVKAGVA
jgi:hypothetical protein